MNNFENTSNKAHLTAITRTNISVPMRFLSKNNYLQGSMLDYGCGKGSDAEQFQMVKYDPYFFPVTLEGKFQTITCNYVLNVVTEAEGYEIIEKIKDLLTDDGTAYITVRRDIKSDYISSRGTYQRVVKLELPVLKENSNFCTYVLKK